MHGEPNADPEQEAEQARIAIERFLSSASVPVLVEPGEEELPLLPGSFEVSLQDGRLTLQAWNERRNLTRRVVGVAAERAGRLDLRVLRFGARAATLQLLDTQKPQNAGLTRKAGRTAFREQFRRMLTRQFPGWQIVQLSAEADLEHSLSPAFPRAFLKRGTFGIAAIGAPAESGNPDGILTFGLIWHRYLRERERSCAVDRLALFLPTGAERTTCLRLLHLNPLAVQASVWSFSSGMAEEPVDLKDHGNVDSYLPPQQTGEPRATIAADAWAERTCQVPGVNAVPLSGGDLSLRVNGLEFARRTTSGLSFGLETKRPALASNQSEIEALAVELARVRSASADPGHALFQRHPESWFEAEVRSSLTTLDASLQEGMIYGQVPAFAAAERGIMDLLAVDCQGRLAVVELKVAEDVHLPLQALDYWLRVRWHLERRDFAAAGYFPGVALSARPPRLLLVAPSLNFHSTTGIILRYFSPHLEVERIGVSMNWRQSLKVMFRMNGWD